MKKWHWLRWFAYVYIKIYLLFSIIFVYSTFLLAYMNPAKRFTILIDFYGEANIELVFLTVVVPFCMYFLLLELKWMFTRNKAEPADSSGQASSSQSVQSQ